MADKEVLELEVKSNVSAVTKDVKNLGKATGQAGGGFKKLGGVIKGMGTALKAAGIGLIVALIAKLMEVFSKNQKVLDIFNTAMTALNIAFNDLFNFLSENVGKFTGFFKSIFEDPKQTLLDFSEMIQNNLIERFNSLLDTFGFVGNALASLFKGNFKEAAEFAKMAGKEIVDVATGVDNSFDKVVDTVTEAVDVVSKYTKETFKQAKAITETNKAAGRAAVEFAKLNAQFLKDAEIQRQIRDDETKTFEERIAANEKLNEILEKQQAAQKEQLQIQINAAQAQFDINANDENFIALQEQKVAMLELEETITGQLSEQKTNQVSLEKELLETQNELRAEGLSGIERELQELETSYQQKLDMARKSGVDTTAIDKQFADKKSKIAQDQVNTQLEAFSGLAGGLQALAGESKELAVGQAIIDTYVGANKALGQAGIAGIAAAAGIIISGLANVKTILSTPIGGSGGGGGGGAAPSAPAPQMMSGAFELTGVEEPEAVKAFVVTDEMTSSQNQLANIRRRATI
jgi:hypothetical protein|tara:strand:- start:765 stop:2324 length:1560 start_codon:yes stop_codon:yes gene_type:complete